ncbi:DUF6551 family protein [Mycolicibacterium fortuitum]|uniref:DUF6551 family protein n=1 Tax=Mycolicibacterium fortuitum TaxID=1766 RepID=UPI003AAAF899
MSTTTVDVTRTAAMARGAYIDALDVDDLFVDHTYQRPADLSRARRLAADWDRRLAGIIEVSDRGTGESPRYAVIDGQHRWEAARLCDEVPVLVASIHEGLTVADEARLFDRLNSQRRQPSTWDHWRARKSSGDPDVLAIEAVVEELGLRIDPGPRAGNVRCTATLEKLAARGGTGLVCETLKLITNVWDRRVESFDAPIVHAIGLIQHHLRGRIDQHRLIDTLMGVTPLSLKTQTAALGDTLTGTAGVRHATTIMVLYNKNRRVPGKPVLVSARSFGGGSRNARSRPLPAKTA